jgi:thymidine kinase
MFVEPQINDTKTGWIEVIAGSMFSGKTEELIRRLKRAKIAKMRVEIFKPVIDIRYHVEKVVSHDDNAIHSTPIEKSSFMLGLSKDIQVVGIDEAQFFDNELPDVCNILANRGIRVIIAGLDMDFQGKPFGPMPQLMAIAEYVTKVHAICMETGQMANYSMRLTQNDEVVELGEKEAYQPVSRKVFWAEMKKKQQKL